MLSSLLVFIRVTNLVDGGQTGMNIGLALAQDRLYTSTESSLRRPAFLININISDDQRK